MKYTLYLLFLFLFGFVQAQVTFDSIQKLDEVVLSDVKLKRYSKGYKVKVLNDSVLGANGISMTDLLRFNSNIYFKENGYGMVSSPSFRGTNASQTAVIWNGININSQLNGQVDFNLISTSNYDKVSIRSGGGSVQYGSGAIGGSIHLSNEFNFENHFTQTLKLGYGSFDTKNGSYSASFGNVKWSGSIGVAYLDSENDYKYLGADRRNENGAFKNLDINVNLGYVLSENTVLKLYHQNFLSHRELSGTLTTSSNSKYEDSNLRTMFEIATRGSRLYSKVKFVHLQEHFKYFGNQDSENFSFGKVNTFISKYNADLNLAKNLKLNASFDYIYFKGEGTSFGNPNRQAFSATATLGYILNKSWNYGVSLRQDFTSGFNSPLVFALDVAYKASRFYQLTLNASKNFRVPTFNDLYWQPGGNLDLKSETSYQIDLGHEVKTSGLNLKLNTFYIRTKNLIQWQPNASGIWSPMNVANVQNYGMETSAAFEKSIEAHQFNLGINYAYTVSENLKTKKELIYVPNHTANLNFTYGYKNISLYYQQLYNGDVFTTSDNLTGRFYSLDAYNVANVGFDYTIFKNLKNELNINVKVNNIYNKAYENVAFRPMPNRNFNTQIQYKF